MCTMKKTNLESKISALSIEYQQVLKKHPALWQLFEELIKMVEKQQAEMERQQSEIEKQQAEIKELRYEVKRLQNQLQLDSHNSSKPPSTDLSRSTSRKKEVNRPSTTKRKPGGQPGHPGTTLQAVAIPDHTILHRASICSHCGEDLSSITTDKIEKRQVFDLPPFKLAVTEHQAEVKTCPHCHQEVKAEFPSGINQPVQYGERVKSLAVYLNQYQLLPYERVTEVFQDLLGQTISQGTLLNALKASYHNLEDTEDWIKNRILHSPVVHCDETGIYRNGKRIWLHSASTKDLTYYFPHSRRGKIAIDEAGILPSYRGVAIHDHWEAYNSYPSCTHAFCNCHHLRELTQIYEQEGASWAKEMKELLLEIKEQTERAKDAGKQALEPELVSFYHHRYQTILTPALQIYSREDTRDKPRRGRKKQSKAKNLLDRLIKYQKETLQFMEDFQVPFDNNLAERDLRMVKVKQKISGCFRSEKGANYFCRIRGFISTVRKQGKNILECLSQTFQPSKVGTILLPEG